MIRGRIIDYDGNKNDVEKWLELKGEWRYSEYADYLESKGISLTWVYLADIYRYDKRLMFNLYRYFSMFEEYLRACHVRENGNTKEAYDSAQELYLRDFEYRFPKKDLEDIKELRNEISHARPLITNELTKSRIELLRKYLPEEYSQGFVTSINNCVNELNLNPAVIIKLI